MKRSGAAAFSWEKQEQIQLQHEGTGTPDTSKHEWRTFQCQDSISTIIMLPGLLSYQANALGLPEEVVRLQLLDKMIQPCGPAPEAPIEQMLKTVKEKIEKGELPNFH